MPKYIIKTERDRNVVVEADKYDLDRISHSYRFLKDGRTVAEFPNTVGGVFAVIEEDAEVADFYEHYDPSEDEDDDPRENDGEELLAYLRTHR